MGRIVSREHPDCEGRDQRNSQVTERRGQSDLDRLNSETLYPLLTGTHSGVAKANRASQRMLLIAAGLSVLWLLIVAVVLALQMSLDTQITYQSRNELP